MVAQYGVVFPDDRVESNLRVFGDAHVPELAVVSTLRAGNELLDCQSDHVRRAAVLARCYCIDLVAQIPRDPDRTVCFGTQEPAP